MRRAPAYPSVMRVTSLRQIKGNSVEPQSRNVFKQCAGNRGVQENWAAVHRSRGPKPRMWDEGGSPGSTQV